MLFKIDPNIAKDFLAIFSLYAVENCGSRKFCPKDMGNGKNDGIEGCITHTILL
jgi:hypothetical protein